MTRWLIISCAALAILVPNAVAGRAPIHWAEGAAGDWQGTDDTGRVRTDLTDVGQIELRDSTGRTRVWFTPNVNSDLDGPMLELNDGLGSRVFSVFASGKVTVGRLEHPSMRIDADGTIHVRPGAIVEDLGP